jgi:hypothetical protein
MFGRDLLADGLLAPTGEGDVRVSPAAQELAAFLDSTYDLVLAGEESSWFDFDHEMEKLAFNY